MQQAVQLDVFSGNVLIAHEGKVVYQKSFGYANWEEKTPFNDSTMFNIGSNGKDFTQAIICQLVQENKLAFRDPLSKYLDMFPKSIADKITIKHLLTMQSGMGDYMQSPRFQFGQIRTISGLSILLKMNRFSLSPEPAARIRIPGMWYLAALSKRSQAKPMRKTFGSAF